MEKLPHHVKAEILASVLHELEHMPEIKFPPGYITRVHRALSDCDIDISELSKDDIKLIDRWFVERGNAP